MNLTAMVALLWLSLAGSDAAEAPRARTAPPTEADFYRLVDLPAPEEVVLEVGGLIAPGEGVIYAATRRGEVWKIDDAYSESPEFTLWLDGLQEPLGLLAHDGWIYTAQRGELSRMRDADGDGRGDEVECVCDAWQISGNYHEYAFGPRLDHDGNFWVTLNRPFGGEPFGKAPFRGWAMRISPDGDADPVCSGLRSPCGVEVAPWGDVFYSDNQGEWCPTNKIAHLKPGSFHGHPYGIGSCHHPSSHAEHPGPVPNGKKIPEVAAEMPLLQLPALWLPYSKMGQSTSGMVWDTTGGKFGPFTGQLFIADQHSANVMLAHLEKVTGEWQGACFPFREGYACGIIRICWGEDGSLVAGMSNRGWGSLGTRPYGIQRLEWTGAMPTEVLAMEARPNGFRLTFTRPMDRATLEATASYAMESYTYLLHEPYGSPEVDRKTVKITAARAGSDGRSVELTCEGLRAGYVHELHLDGLRATDGVPLLHPVGYYTLNAIPAE